MNEPGALDGPSPPARHRTSRARANDAAILQAAARVLAGRGWDQLALTAVAEEAGLTTRPLYDRYGDRASLGVALWESGPGPELVECARTLVDLMVRPEEAEVPGEEAVLSAYEPFIRPTGDLATAVDLLGAVLVCPELEEAVSGSLVSALGDRVMTSQGVDPVDATRSVYVLISALGLLLGSRQPAAAHVDVRSDAIELRDGLRHPGPVLPLPEVDASHMRGIRVETDDPALSALLSATLVIVGERGYHAATTARIVAAAGVSEGLMYGRYATKLDLFLDATGRSLNEAFRINLEMARRLTEEYGPAVSEATVFRETLRPDHASGRMAAIEQLRLGWHEPRMRKHLETVEGEILDNFMADRPPEQRASVEAFLHWGMCLAYGAYVTARLLPDSWTLPFVTIVGPLAHAPE